MGEVPLYGTNSVCSFSSAFIEKVSALRYVIYVWGAKVREMGLRY